MCVLYDFQDQENDESISVQIVSTPEEIQEFQYEYYGIKSDLDINQTYSKRAHLSNDKLITYLNQFVKDSEASEIESRKIPSSLHLAEFAYFFNQLFVNGWFGNPTSGETLNKSEYATLLLRAFNVKNNKGEISKIEHLMDMFSKPYSVNRNFRAKVNEAIVKISEIETMRNEKKVKNLKK